MNTSNYKKKDKYVTAPVFEESRASIARSFAQVDERFDTFETSVNVRFNAVDARFDRTDIVLEKILNEIKELRHESREDRQSIASLAYNQLKFERLLEQR